MRRRRLKSPAFSDLHGGGLNADSLRSTEARRAAAALAEAAVVRRLRVGGMCDEREVCASDGGGVAAAERRWWCRAVRPARSALQNEAHEMLAIAGAARRALAVLSSRRPPRARRARGGGGAAARNWSSTEPRAARRLRGGGGDRTARRRPSAASLGLAPPPSTAPTAAEVGRVACDGGELLVLGTAHTPCARAPRRVLLRRSRPNRTCCARDRPGAARRAAARLLAVRRARSAPSSPPPSRRREGVGAIPVLGDAKVTPATLTLVAAALLTSSPPRQARDTLDALRLGAGAWFADPKRFRRATRIALPRRPPTTSRSKPSTSRRPFAKIRTSDASRSRAEFLRRSSA